MFENREYTTEEIQMLQEDDDNSSHAEMIVKGLGAFSTGAQKKIASECAAVQEGYELFIFFRYEEDLNDLIEGRKTLSRFSPLKPDPYKDPAGYADFCNMINVESTRGELMAAALNVIMNHLPGARKFGVAVDTDNLPVGFDIVFCFSDPILHAQIERAQKMLETVM